MVPLLSGRVLFWNFNENSPSMNRRRYLTETRERTIQSKETSWILVRWIFTCKPKVTVASLATPATVLRKGSLIAPFSLGAPLALWQPVQVARGPWNLVQASRALEVPRILILWDPSLHLPAASGRCNLVAVVSARVRQPAVPIDGNFRTRSLLCVASFAILATIERNSLSTFSKKILCLSLP